MSLETACREIVGPSSMIGLEEHLSRDDAKMEMLILEAICVLEQKDSMTLLNESPFAKTNSLEFFEKIRQRNIKRRMKAAGHDLYRSLISSEDELDLEENKGKRYNISGDLKCHIEELKKTVEVIKRNNGIFSNNLSKTDFFIVLDDKNKEDIIKSGKFFFDGEIITYKEFIAND